LYFRSHYRTYNNTGKLFKNGKQKWQKQKFQKKSRRRLTTSYLISTQTPIVLLTNASAFLASLSIFNPYGVVIMTNSDSGESLIWKVFELIAYAY
jgi:hypothetical protein